MSGPLRTGKIIDGFELEKRIQAGGMGALWGVRHPQYKIPLIMKFPLIRYGDDSTAIVGFEVEQMILSKLSGPHVPKFIAARDFSDRPYLVMERITGGALLDQLGKAPLSVEEVLSIGARVAWAIHSLHKQDVIHLDIKPSNIMFRESGEAVLIDFGFAHHNRLPDLLAEEFSIPMGTRTYISPEQIMRIRTEPKSDLFALGILLYHLITGKRPFNDPTTEHGMRRRLYMDPLPPRARNPKCPAYLQELILKCLEVEPKNRPETAAEVGFLLQNPAQVVLTSRSTKLTRDPFLKRAKRWIRSLGENSPEFPKQGKSKDHAPIVVVAVDLSAKGQPITEKLKEIAHQTLQTLPGARLACVSVLKVRHLAIDTPVDRKGRNLHVVQLGQLKHWASQLDWPAERITYHVLVAPDPAKALLDYARTNHVDHIVMGARGSSAIRRYLGSVSAKVVAQALCTVTVIRLGQK